MASDGGHQGARIAVRQLFPGVKLTVWFCGTGWRFGGWKVTPQPAEQGPGITQHRLHEPTSVHQRRLFKTAEEAVEFYREVLQGSGGMSNVAALAPIRR